MNVLEGTLNIDFIRGTISGPRSRDGIVKVKIRPLEKKGELYFQLEAFTKTQAFHENAAPQEAMPSPASAPAVSYSSGSVDDFAELDTDDDLPF